MPKKMGKTICTFIIILSSITFSTAQTSNWAWAKSASGSGVDGVGSLETDNIGNIYLSGYFDTPFIIFGNDTLYSAGDKDIFLVKYNEDGNLIWAKRFGGSDEDMAGIITCDFLGNIYLMCDSKSTYINFGNDTITNTGFQEILIIKCDSFGNVIWVKNAVGDGYVGISAATTDKNGNLFITGMLMSSSLAFGTDTLINQGNSDAFIVKYDSSGNVIWTKHPGGLYEETGGSITSDTSGNIYVFGVFSSPAITFGSYTLIREGTFDMFIVKFDGNGNTLWAKSVGGVFNDLGDCLHTDNAGNLFVTGSYNCASVIFGQDTLININPGSADVFIAQYDQLGNVNWAKSAGGNQTDFPLSIAGNNNGNIYFAGGYYSPAITFGTNTLVNTNAGLSDLFIVKCDNLGNMSWAISEGGIYEDIIYSILLDGAGNLYAAGQFYSPTISFDNCILTNTGNFDVFIAKLYSNARIDDREIGNKVFIYPNPMSNSTNINITIGQISNCDLKIFNISGRIVYEKKLTKQNETLNLNLPDGMYFFQVINIDKIIGMGKIIIQK